MHYYNYNRILSYNAPVNILIGERGCGKSYGAKNYVIKQFLKNHSQFVYLRRYENELKALTIVNCEICERIVEQQNSNPYKILSKALRNIDYLGRNSKDIKTIHDKFKIRIEER